MRINRHRGGKSGTDGIHSDWRSDTRRHTGPHSQDRRRRCERFSGWLLWALPLMVAEVAIQMNRLREMRPRYENLPTIKREDERPTAIFGEILHSRPAPTEL
jgi:hypothetical protein